VTKELDDMLLYDFKNKRWIQFFEELVSPVKPKASLSPGFIRSMKPGSPNRTSSNNNDASFNLNITSINGVKRQLTKKDAGES